MARIRLTDRQANRKKSKTPLGIHLGNKMAGIRQGRQITQREAANMCGLSSAAWCDAENGFHVPTLHTILAMSVAFGVPFNHWIDGYEVSTDQGFKEIK